MATRGTCTVPTAITTTELLRLLRLTSATRRPVVERATAGRRDHVAPRPRGALLDHRAGARTTRDVVELRRIDRREVVHVFPLVCVCTRQVQRACRDVRRSVS